MLERHPFTYENKIPQKKKPISVKLNDNDRAMLKECKPILQQERDSTILKQLAHIGAKVLLKQENKYISAMVFKNSKNNKRIGIIEVE